MTYDLSLFSGQGYFNDKGAQFYLMFEALYKTIKKFSGLPTMI